MQAISTEHLEALKQIGRPFSYLRDVGGGTVFPTKSTFVPGANGRQLMSLAYNIMQVQTDMDRYISHTERLNKEIAALESKKRISKANARALMIARQDHANIQLRMRELKQKYAGFEHAIFNSTEDDPLVTGRNCRVV